MNPNRVNLDALGVSISAAVPRISIPPVPSVLERLNASPFADLSRTLASLQKAASPLAALAASLAKVAKSSAAMGRALRRTGTAYWLTLRTPSGCSLLDRSRASANIGVDAMRMASQIISRTPHEKRRIVTLQLTPRDSEYYSGAMAVGIVRHHARVFVAAVRAWSREVLARLLARHASTVSDSPEPGIVGALSTLSTDRRDRYRHAVQCLASHLAAHAPPSRTEARNAMRAPGLLATHLALGPP